MTDAKIASQPASVEAGSGIAIVEPLLRQLRLYETLLGSTPDFAYLLDLQGRFTFANKALLDLWGISLDQAIGKSFEDLKYPVELASKLSRQIQQVIATKARLKDETDYLSPTGERGYYEYVFVPVIGLNGEVEAVAGSTHVLTERRQLETDRERLLAALANERARLAAVVHQAPAFICTLRGPTYIFELANERYLQLVGRRDIIGQPVRDAFPDVAGQGFFELLDQVYRTGEPFVGNEVPIVFQAPGQSAADMRYLNFVYQPLRDDDQTISGIFVHGIDVTDLVRSREALRDQDEKLRTSEERLAFAVDSAELGTFFCPMPMGKIHWNAKCAEHFFITPDQDVNFDRFYSLLHPEDRLHTQKAVEAAVFNKQVYDVQYRVVSPVGEIRWLRAKGRAYHDARGVPIRFDGITLDITDRKRDEEYRHELLESERAARAAADRAGRMKDEFLATLSHELRTPLNAILGWSQILASGGNRDEEELTEGLKTIERNARAQTQIIEDLLDMSRIISGKVRLNIQPIELSTAVKAAVETIRPAAQSKGVELQTTLDTSGIVAGGSPINGDLNRLQQVFWNLLSNAVKFTPKGGCIRVVLEACESQLCVSITDTGEGIRPEFLPHVFDRFRQADASITRRHGGLGLGLAIVKQLVELHGGTASVHSDGKGLGSTFRVSLPVRVVTISSRTQGSDADIDSHTGSLPTSNLSAAELSERPSLTGIKVLVVDDEPDARSLVKRLLRDCDASVVIAGTVAEAFQLFCTTTPDILVSDIGMPGEDGYALIRRIRNLPFEQGGQVPAVALTAYARSEDRMRALRAGYQTHVVKPVEPMELLAVVGSLVGRAIPG